MPGRTRSSFQLLVVSSLFLLVFTWGYLSLTAQLRELAERQAQLEEVVYSKLIIERPCSRISSPPLHATSLNRRNVSNLNPAARGSTILGRRATGETPPSVRPGGVWRTLNLSGFLPSIPDTEREKCSDAICSEFVSSDKLGLQCAETVGSKMAKNESVSPTCRFQNGASRPLYLLRSYPGSGNTWVRQVLEKATGICTG